MNNQRTHAFTDLTGAIDEKHQPSAVGGQRVKILSVNVKFSDVITQDLLYINRLNSIDEVLAQYGYDLSAESATATNFTWVPPVEGLKLAPGEKIQITFANNDARTLSSPESNITYEFI